MSYDLNIHGHGYTSKLGDNTPYDLNKADFKHRLKNDRPRGPKGSYRARNRVGWINI